MSQKRIAVIGAGAWGSAIALCLAHNGHDVSLWLRSPEEAASIARDRVNQKRLPDVPLSERIHPTADLDLAVTGAEQIYFVIPTQFMRPVLEQLALSIPPTALVVLASKGIENETLLFPVDIAKELLPGTVRLAVLSGPTFAKEIAARTPAAATVATADDADGALIQETLSTDWFRLYLHHDLIGVELGGAVKNVMAIAAGVSDGLGFGHNARAALITRGLAEIARLGEKMGADPVTMTGLAGIGDLVLTCTGDLSRNRTVGLRLGRGESMESIAASMASVAEGVATARSLHHLAKREGVDLPIALQVYRIVHEGADPKETVSRLMGRSLKPEFGR